MKEWVITIREQTRDDERAVQEAIALWARLLVERAMRGQENPKAGEIPKKAHLG